MGFALYHLRTALRQRWRSYVAITVLIGVVGGIGLFAIAGARRTQSAYPRFLRSVNGKITTFQVGESAETEVWRINKNGALVGLYNVGARTIHAFLRTP